MSVILIGNDYINNNNNNAYPSFNFSAAISKIEKGTLKPTFIINKSNETVYECFDKSTRNRSINEAKFYIKELIAKQIAYAYIILVARSKIPWLSDLSYLPPLPKYSTA